MPRLGYLLPTRERIMEGVHETAPLLAAFTGIETSHVLAMKRVTCGEYLDPRDIQPAIDAAAKYKIIDKGFPAQELISPYALKPRA